MEPQVWHSVGIDFARPFPETSKGHRYIIIVIDYFSKYSEVLATKDQTSRTAAAFLQQLFDRFGVMSTIHCDHGKHFLGEFKALMDENFVDSLQSRPYNPQANGLVERAVRTITTAA